jgi:hypothetical protein
VTFRLHKREYSFLIPFVLAPVFLSAGCYFQRQPAPDQTIHPFRIERLLVTGFFPALPSGAKRDLVRSPLSGAVFMAEPVPKEAVDLLTSSLLLLLEKKGTRGIISPHQAEGLSSDVRARDPLMRDLEVFREMGKAFEADAVLTGNIYLWREREGTEYAVNRPAAVAYDLYLIRTVDGTILWKGRFEKTQRSLSENLLDLETFLKGKGTWMEAKDLAEMGLIQLMETWPKAEEEGKD